RLSILRTTIQTTSAAISPAVFRAYCKPSRGRRFVSARIRLQWTIFSSVHRRLRRWPAFTACAVTTRLVPRYKDLGIIGTLEVKRRIYDSFTNHRSFFCLVGGNPDSGADIPGAGRPRWDIQNQGRGSQSITGDGNAELSHGRLWASPDRLASNQGRGRMDKEKAHGVGACECEPGIVGTLRTRLVE